MAKKAELLLQAKELKLEVTAKNTIAEIENAIKNAAKKVKKDAKKVEKAVKDDAKVVATDAKETIAKAGKRSAKAIKEAEDKLAKEERKITESHEPTKPRQIIKVRSKVERKGKKYRKAIKDIDKTKQYNLKDAAAKAVAASTTKFDSSVELHVRLGVDPRQADQNLRASLILPEGTGKKVTVAVFADAEDVKKAKTAGADIAANEEFLQQLDKGTLNFDVLIATPAMMPKLGKYARVLGPKGLMPSPKSGTVTTDVSKAVKEAKAGKVEYRVDSTGIVHLSIGKTSFGADKIVTNAKAVLASLKSARPASVKGNYLQSMYITTTMGPSVKIDNSEF